MRILNPTLLCLFLVSVTALAGNPPQPPAGLQISPDCRQHLSRLQNTADSFHYGWITVPQSASRPRPVHVFYQANVFKDENQNTINPVVFFNGGPSMDSHHSLITLLSTKEYTSGISLILLDQRGTGCSSSYPDSPVAGDLQDFGSRQIVNDAEAVRRHLSIQKWTAFGQSYGGLIVQRYVETQPDSLNKAVIHGMALGSISADAAVHRFEKGVAMLAQYLADHPHMQEQMQAIRDSIPEDYCLISSGFFNLCGPALMDLHVVFTRNINQPEMQQGFEQWIQYLHDLMITQALSPGHPAIQDYWRQLSGHAIGQDVKRYYWEQVISKQEITPGFADLETGQLFQSDSGSLVSEARLMRSFVFEDNSFLDVAVDSVSLETVRGNLQTRPQLKLFIFAGEKDIFSPATTIRSQYENHMSLDNVVFEAFENSGHEGYNTEANVIRSVTQ